MAAITDDDMKTMEAVAQLLKTKPSNVPAHSKPDIPALWEELAILVSSGLEKKNRAREVQKKAAEATVDAGLVNSEEAGSKKTAEGSWGCW